jgi:paraquat-inducible protein B
MSKKANPALVGSFVAGALALIVVAVIALGGSQLFRERPRAVAYFDGSVNGLQVGAPVTWLGVRIGSVTEVRMDFDANRRTVRIPVFMEFEPERINIVGGDAELLKIRDLVAKGLRASLQQQSLVTGQLFVDLTMRPDTDARLVGPTQFLIPEIPTVLSDFDTLKATLERLPLKDLGAEAIRTLAAINKLVASPETQTALTELTESTKELHALLAKVDGQGEPFPTLKKLDADFDAINDVFAGKNALGKSTIDTIEALHAAAETANNGIGHVTAGLADTLKNDLNPALKQANDSLRDAQLSLAALNSVIGPASQQRADLNQILRNLAYTTQSLRSFSEQLDRNPSALLTGKK